MTPEAEPRMIWTDVVGGVEWKLFIREIYEGRAIDPVTDEPIADSQVTIWYITLIAADGEKQEGWWAPDGHILGVHLSGWSKSAVGSLKRHLISLGKHP